MIQKITTDEYKKLTKKRPATKSKFHNVKTTVDNIRFDSKKEAERYSQLKLMERAKAIRNLRYQSRFKLEVKGQLVCEYVADFTYLDQSGLVVEDVKSPFTRKNAVYRLKKKLMAAVLGIEIREV